MLLLLGASHHKTDAGPGSYHNLDDDDGDDDDDDDDDEVEREIFSKSEGEQMDWPSQGCHLISVALLSPPLLIENNPPLSIQSPLKKAMFSDEGFKNGMQESSRRET